MSLTRYTRSSSADEAANVNFFNNDIVHQQGLILRGRLLFVVYRM